MADLLRWIARITILFQRCLDAWRDMKLMAPMHRAWEAQFRRAQVGPDGDPTTVPTANVQDGWAKRERDRHDKDYPFESPVLRSMMTNVLADLRESQREVLQRTMYNRNLPFTTLLPDTLTDMIKLMLPLFQRHQHRTGGRLWRLG